jgi:hypothetical protein
MAPVRQCWRRDFIALPGVKETQTNPQRHTTDVLGSHGRRGGGVTVT